MVSSITYGEVLYDNALRKALDLSWDGTEVAGFTYLNLIDYNDWSLFVTELSADRRLTAYLPFNERYDTLALWVVPFNVSLLSDEAVIDYSFIGEAQIGGDTDNGECTVSVELETGDGTGVYTVIATKLISGTTEFWYIHLPQVYQQVSNERLRIRFNNSAGSQLVVRQLMIGERLKFPTGQHNDAAMLTLTSAQIFTNSMSANGSNLGRQTRRSEKTAEIRLEHLQPGWVRKEWEQFTRHMKNYGCIYVWNYEQYPNDVGYCVASDLVMPQNMRPPPLMQVSMPLRAVN